MKTGIYVATWWFGIAVAIAAIHAADVWCLKDVRDWVFGQTGAAWIQAFGSIGAIFGAIAIAQQQTRNAARLASRDAAEQQLRAAEKLAFLADGSVRAFENMHGQLGTREHLTVRAQGGMEDMLLSLERLREQFRELGTSDLPVALLRPFNVIAGSLDQYLWKIKSVIEWHRAMDEGAFADYFRVFQNIRRVTEEERAEVAGVVGRLTDEVAELCG